MTKTLHLGPLPPIRNSTEDTYTLSTGVPAFALTKADGSPLTAANGSYLTKGGANG